MLAKFFYQALGLLDGGGAMQTVVYIEGSFDGFYHTWRKIGAALKVLMKGVNGRVNYM